MDNLVFIGGVHGVGKTAFCNTISEKHKIPTYSASSLISRKRLKDFMPDKKVENISGNQNILLEALKELDLGEEWILLDGHFCLISNEGLIERIPETVFLDIHPKAIIVLVDSAKRIV